jgi:hypothetical protein
MIKGLGKTYAAAAPKISCRLALVKNDNTAENTSVKTRRIPIVMGVFGPDVLTVLRCQSRYTGMTSRSRIINVIINVTSISMRDLV